MYVSCRYFTRLCRTLRLAPHASATLKHCWGSLGAIWALPCQKTEHRADNLVVVPSSSSQLFCVRLVLLFWVFSQSGFLSLVLLWDFCPHVLRSGFQAHAWRGQVVRDQGPGLASEAPSPLHGFLTLVSLHPLLNICSLSYLKLV